MLAGMDPEAAVRAVHQYSVEEFQAIWASVREFILIETLDNVGRAQGHAVVQLLQAYQADRVGAFASLRYCGCSDEYYQYWVDNDMPANAHHHFCLSTSLRTCRGKVGSEGIVHVLKWCPLTRGEGEKLMRDWGLSPALLQRRLKPVVAGVPALPEPSGSPQSKSAPAGVPKTLRSPPREEHRDRGRRRRKEAEADEGDMASGSRTKRPAMARPVTPPEPPPPKPRGTKRKDPDSLGQDAGGGAWRP